MGSTIYQGRVQGNCNSTPSVAQLGLTETTPLDWKAGQCVLVTHVQLMTVYQSLWLHGLYIRHHVTNIANHVEVVGVDSKNGNLWLTDVTIQVRILPLRTVPALMLSLSS